MDDEVQSKEQVIYYENKVNEIRNRHIYTYLSSTIITTIALIIGAVIFYNKQ